MFCWAPFYFWWMTETLSTAVSHLTPKCLAPSQAHLTRGQERYSLVAIRISTGRRHQIRAHLAHAGHPVVCDAKYGQSSQVDEGGRVEQYHQDLQWCSRNFLHRYRLAWDSKEPSESHEALAVLPSELKEALGQLSPRLQAGRVCPTSAKQLQWWLEGKVLTDSADWDQFPQLIHSASILGEEE